MNARTRRILIWGALAALVAAGLAWAFRPQPVAVDLAEVDRGKLRVAVSEEGKAEVRDVYGVSAPIGGRLLRIQVEAGDPVVAGQTELARIEPAAPAFLDVRTESEARAAVEAARAARDLAAAELERAQAELAFAASELDRVRKLFGRGTVSQRQLDEAQRAQRVASAQVSTAQAELDVRAHELEVARARVLSRPELDEMSEACECVTLRAPVDGRILRVLQESETVVNAGTLLLEIGDPQDIEIVVDLLSEDAVRVHPGQRAVIDGWGGPPLEAVVRRVEPYGYTKVSALGIEEQRVDVRLDLADPGAAAGLGHGYRVDVSIIFHDAEVLQVPLGALFRDDGDWFVFVAQDGRAVARAVEVGVRNDHAAEVLSGLEAGERVVLYPSDRVADGQRIADRGE
jgi:HlyD family secretion protein